MMYHDFNYKLFYSCIRSSMLHCFHIALFNTQHAECLFGDCLSPPSSLSTTTFLLQFPISTDAILTNPVAARRSVVRQTFPLQKEIYQTRIRTRTHFKNEKISSPSSKNRWLHTLHGILYPNHTINQSTIQAFPSYHTVYSYCFPPLTDQPTNQPNPPSLSLPLTSSFCHRTVSSHALTHPPTQFQTPPNIHPFDPSMVRTQYPNNNNNNNNHKEEEEEEEEEEEWRRRSWYLPYPTLNK